MPGQITLGGIAAGGQLNAGTMLDAMFTDLYGVWNVFQPVAGVLVGTAQINLSMNGPALLLSATAAAQGASVYLRSGTSTRWQYGMDNSAESGSNAGANFFVNSFSDSNAYLSTPIQISRSTGVVTTNALVVAGSITPSFDNTLPLGGSAKRWSVVYAASGSINTSDGREKTAVAPLTPAEIEAAKLLAREVGGFKFLAAVQAKGVGARTHIGMTVQRAMEIMTSQGLDPLAYGFVCHDTWPAETVPAVTGRRETALKSPDGQTLYETIIVRPERVIPAGDRFGFRTDELLLFIARGLEARLTALEAKA